MRAAGTPKAALIAACEMAYLGVYTFEMLSAPFCAMLLSDLGAEVVRIDRPHAGGGGPAEVLARGRRSAAFNLKSPGAVKACLSMMKSAHIVLEGYRPGVMERLGLGPEEALKANPSLTNLTLKNNKLGDQNARLLSYAIFWPRKPRITRLGLHGNDLEEPPRNLALLAGLDNMIAALPTVR